MSSPWIFLTENRLPTKFIVRQFWASRNSSRRSTHSQHGWLMSRHLPRDSCGGAGILPQWPRPRSSLRTIIRPAIPNPAARTSRSRDSSEGYWKKANPRIGNGEMVFGFMASLAQFESSLISERVKAGMQRAKEEGKHVGRPPIPEDTQAEVQRLYTEEDVSINKISERLDISYGTAWNYVQEVKGE